jgi:hypothetical protein
MAHRTPSAKPRTARRVTPLVPRLVPPLVPPLGVLLALAVALACGGDRPVTGGGAASTRVLLTDAPFPYDSVAEVNVHIERIEANTSLDTTSASAGWVTVAAPARRFNLLSLQNGATALLGETALPASQYPAVRMTIDADRSDVVDVRGRRVAVTWPRRGTLLLHAHVQTPLDVGARTGSIVIDFDVGRSFLCLTEPCGSTLTFIPWFRAVAAEATGTITGVVTASGGSAVANASVEVIPSEAVGDSADVPVGSAWATGRTDAQGRFTIAYVSPRTYHVRVTAPRGSGLGAVVRRTVEVTLGQTTTLTGLLLPKLGAARGAGTE